MTKEQIEDLLDNVLHSPSRRDWKGSNIQFCCTVHGESNPSAGINIDFVPDDSNDHHQVFHCFSCGEGGTIPWLVFKSLPDKFKNLKEVEKFLQSRYKVTFGGYRYDQKTHTIKRYEDLGKIQSVERFELPRTKLAPFKSGKETYQYFFDRGFTKEDMIKFSIGRDLESETVTIPAFWEDGTLAGIIGRYIDPRRPKNMRFKVYEFPKGSLIYPLDKLEVIDNTIIGVESMFDVIMLHRWGYPNTIAMMGDGMSKAQADMIVSRCNTFIDLFDNDKGGRIARDIAKKRLGNRVMYLTPTYYPEEGKDPSEWKELETNKVINSASYLTTGSIPRL